jgi:predicted permease
LGGNENMTFIATEGAAPVPRGKEPLAEGRVITPGYFGAMGMSLMRGREFDAMDDADKPPVAIVNETLARQFFPLGDAVGKRIKDMKVGGDWKTIVGVVRDVRGHALETQARLQLYVPYAQEGRYEMVMAVRADAAALPSLRSALQQELKQLDALLPVANYRTMPELVSKATARPRFVTLLLGLFAAAALMLTVIGLYGVVAYGVNQRTREIGIRVALGAQPRDVLTLVIGQGMKLVLAGVALGISAAFALTRLLKELLFGVSATDPLTYGLIALLLMLVALLACWIPARRATKVDPLVALRRE